VRRACALFVVIVLRRIAALKMGKVSQIDSTANCVPVHVSKKGLTLVWASTPQQIQQEEDSGDYSCAPLESAGSLIAEISTHDVEADSEDTANFQWWLGPFFCCTHTPSPRECYRVHLPQ